MEDVPSQEEQAIRLIADQKAVELGFDPETTGPEVFRELRPYDHDFLDEEGIDERDTLWAVNYAPPLHSSWRASCMPRRAGI